VLSLESTWQCHHKSAIRQIEQTAQRDALDAWKADPTKGQVLKSVKSEFKRNHYLFHASGANARLIARARHNRLGHNASMYKMNQGRVNTTQTPCCPFCPDQPESIHHMIMVCPQYNVQRDALNTQLRTAGLQLTDRVILNEHWDESDFDSPARKRRSKAVIRHTAEFIRYICEQRDFTII
jgi:hypothetical protein